jgi:hypothetical protein
MAFTVHVTQSGSTAVGMAVYLSVLTGAGAAQPGSVGGSGTRSSTSLSQTLTPLGSGSFVYASILALGTSGTLSALGGQTMKYQPNSGGLSYNTVALTGTTAGSNITIGATDTGSSAISISAVEILQAVGNTLTLDASSPGGAVLGNTSMTTASFAPPAGSLLMASVGSNGGSGIVSISVTDTSGLGLTWVEQEAQHATGNGYTGIWTAFMPVSSTVRSPGVALMGVG